MFHIINSMSLVEFTLFMIIAIVICIVGLIKLKESQKTWKWVYYFCIIGFCFYIVERAVSEYMPGTTLDEICNILLFASLPVFIVFIIIVGYFANKNQKK